MNYAILHMNEGLGGLSIHLDPNGKIIDEIEPTVWMQWVGTPKVDTGLVNWLEVTYCRPRGLPQRGWVAEHLVTKVHDKMFRPNLTVHERQVAMDKATSFPKPPDIEKHDVLPAPDHLSPGMWLVLGLAVLCVLGVLFKYFLHIN